MNINVSVRSKEKKNNAAVALTSAGTPSKILASTAQKEPSVKATHVVTPLNLVKLIDSFSISNLSIFILFRVFPPRCHYGLGILPPRNLTRLMSRLDHFLNSLGRGVFLASVGVL